MLWDHSTDTRLLVNEEGIIQDVNRRGEIKLVAPADHLIGTKVEDLFLEEDLEYARRRVAGRCAHRVACLSWRVPWLQSGGSSLGLAIRTARSGRCASLALFTNPQKRQALRRNIQWIDEEHTFRKKRAIHIFSENFT